MSEPLEVNPAEYHSRLKINRADIFAEDSYLSKSVLWQLTEMSLHRWRYDPPVFKGSAAVDWGSVVDCLVTTPDQLDELVELHDFKDFRTKAAQKARDEAKSEGKIFLKESELAEMKTAADKILAHPIAGEIIKKSHKQVVLINYLQGVKFKSLVDLAPAGENYLCDLKTTGDLSRSGVEKTIGNFGYHVQAAIYLALWNKCFPDDRRTHWRFIWQSQSAPYEIGVSDLPVSDIETGKAYVKHLIDKLKTAQRTNCWPGPLGEGVATIGIPVYVAMQEGEEIDGGNELEFSS